MHFSLVGCRGARGSSAKRRGQADCSNIVRRIGRANGLLVKRLSGEARGGRHKLSHDVGDSDDLQKHTLQLICRLQYIGRGFMDGAPYRAYRNLERDTMFVRGRRSASNRITQGVLGGTCDGLVVCSCMFRLRPKCLRIQLHSSRPGRVDTDQCGGGVFPHCAMGACLARKRFSTRHSNKRAGVADFSCCDRPRGAVVAAVCPPWLVDRSVFAALCSC